MRRDDYLVVWIMDGSLERALGAPKARVSRLGAVVRQDVNAFWTKKRLELCDPLGSQGPWDDDQMGEALDVVAIQKRASLLSMACTERAGLRTGSNHSREHAHLGWVEGAPYVQTRGIR